MKKIVTLGMASAFLLSSFGIALAQNPSDKMQNNKAETSKSGTAKSKSSESTKGQQGGQ